MKLETHVPARLPHDLGRVRSAWLLLALLVWSPACIRVPQRVRVEFARTKPVERDNYSRVSAPTDGARAATASVSATPSGARPSVETRQ